MQCGDMHVRDELITKDTVAQTGLAGSRFSTFSDTCQSIVSVQWKSGFSFLKFKRENLKMVGDMLNIVQL